MAKVSFDYDGTSTYPRIQKMMKTLIEKGLELHIVTQRPFHGDIFHTPKQWDNTEVFKLAEELGIPQERIHFLSYGAKRDFFIKNRDFIFHLDDDYIEIDQINEDTFVKGIMFDIDWEENIYITLKNSGIIL